MTTRRKWVHNGWDSELSTYLSKIKRCEKCGVSGDLDKAHRLKRRLIGSRLEEDRLEYFMAAKLCRTCHKGYDEYEGPNAHERMFTEITKLILERPDSQTVGDRVTSTFLVWDPERVYNYRERVLHEDFGSKAEMQNYDKIYAATKAVAESEPEEIDSLDGYRRTSVKKRDRNEAERRAQEFRDRGEVVKVIEQAGYHIVYMKIEKGTTT